MTLSEYLSTMGLTQAAFAREIPCTEAYVSMLVNGKARPGWRMAMRIESVTSGMVPHTLWFDTNQREIIGDEDDQSD